MPIENLNRKLSEVLEKLHYLEMVIRNLKENHDSYLVDVEGIDEKLFAEIATYEILTEEMKKAFLELLMSDAMSIAARAVQQPDFHEKAFEMLSGIERMLHSLYKHEKIDIDRSEVLKGLATNAYQELTNIKNEMEKRLKKVESDRKNFSRTQDIHRISK